MDRQVIISTVNFYKFLLGKCYLIFDLILDEKVEEPLLSGDPMLSFPEDTDIDNVSSGFFDGTPEADKQYDNVDDENFSDLLSASQLASLMSDTNALEQPFTPQLSHFSSDDKSDNSESMLLNCKIHNSLFSNAEKFETHQINKHVVSGRIPCGVCEKMYASKYLRRNHFKTAHLKERFVCGVENCSKIYLQKCHKDAHERTHVPVDSSENLCYVCEKCNTVVDSLSKLKQHRLQHSSTKKYPCRVCKVKGYTHADDRFKHECQCCHDHNCKIVNGIVVPKENPKNQGQNQTSEINVQKEQTGARKKLFVSEKTKR